MKINETTTNLNTEVKMLTDKAKRDFERWLLKKGNEIIKNGTIEYDLYYMCKYMIPENMVCAKIIEWFDTVGLHISIEPNLGGGAVVFYSKVFYRHPENFVDTWYDVENEGFSPKIFYFSDRQSATKAAIEQANLIYNER